MDQGEDVLVKRTTIEKFSKTYYPDFENDGTRKYILTYDPASRLDNSVVLVAELFRDEEKGLMLKLVNMVNLVERAKDGTSMVIQKPKQMEIFKNMMVDYNLGYVDYEGIDSVFIDAGAGGGGFEVGQHLLTDFKGKDGRLHRGIIDPENEYMKLYKDDYPSADPILNLFSFKKDKTAAYEATQAMINQGLVIFPKGLNVRNELEFEVENPDGSMSIKYEKPGLDEINSITQMDLAKEELMGMQKTKKPNGTIVFEQTPAAKSINLHDD